MDNTYDYLDPIYTDYSENCTNEPWSDFEDISELGSRQLAALVCYGLVFLLGTPGNAVVIWVTAFRMPRSVNTQWFLQLALADLLCCLSLPLLMVPLAGDHHWPYGHLGCKLLTSVFNLTMYCSVLLLVLISLDRWLLVCRPVWCQNRRTPKHAMWACLGAWALALLLSAPHFVYMEQTRMGKEKVICQPKLSPEAAWAWTGVRSLLGFLLPFLVIVGSHLVVYTRAAQGQGRGRSAASVRSRRTRRVICAVVVSFFLCWFPLHVVDFVFLATPHDSQRRPAVYMASALTLCLAYFNSCLNPLLYVCMGRSFKDTLKQSFAGVLSFMAEEHSRTTQTVSNSKSTDTNTV